MIVQQIRYEDCLDWFLKKHYAKRIPSISYAFGLYVDNILIGIVSYGTPASSTLIRGICGDEYSKNVLELNRLVINSNAPKNSASFLVGNSIKQLPKNSIIVSYADKGQGHNGYVYQATNFIYTGLSSKFLDPKVKGLEHQHHATYANGLSNKDLKEKYGDRLYFVDRSRKHRYVYFKNKKMQKLLKYKIEPYPKEESKKYECIDINQFQMRLF